MLSSIIFRALPENNMVNSMFQLRRVLIAAGIRGFEPFNPHPHREPPEVVRLLVHSDEIHFPSLAKLNGELGWDPAEIEAALVDPALCEDFEVLVAPANPEVPEVCAEPVPLARPPSPRLLPQLNNLVSATAHGRDKLLLIGYSIPGVAAPEWSVVRVLWESSLSLYLSCLQVQDGHFLVEFFICHPNDTAFNALKQLSAPLSPVG